jgi:hypothetical protein
MKEKNMDLKDFISQTLVDIIEGIKAAQEKTQPGCIVPALIARNFKAVETGISQVQAVDFEVTVRADKKEGSEAKLNVVAAVIGGGVKGESGKTGGHAATLKFRVPVSLPESSTPKDKSQETQNQ